MKRLILMLIRKLVNFIDEIEIPDLDINEDEIQQTVNKCWKIAIKPPERKGADCGGRYAVR